MYAIDSLCPENLQTFLEFYNKSKINVKYEDRNCLHLLMSIFDNQSKRSEFKNISECLKLLVAAGCDPNMPDGNSRTPFFILLKAKRRLDSELHKDLVEFFLQKSSVDVHTYRSEEMIQEMQIQNLPIPVKVEKVIDGNYLSDLLINDNAAKFIEDFPKFKEIFGESQIDVNESSSDNEDVAMLIKPNNDSNDYQENCAAFLVTATKSGMTNVVAYLLEQGIDINKYPKFDQPAAFLAASRGYHEILELFLDHTNEKHIYDLELNFERKNLLHEVCKHFGMATDVDSKQSYQKCFDLLISCPEIDINQQDELGLTPLYYTIRYKNDQATKALLRRCYVGKKNLFKKAQIYHIEKEVFEEFLDECITREIHEASGDEKITINFNFLVAPTKGRQSFFDEIAPLEDIANNAELRPLILHPVLSSFLFLKWIKLSIMFYTNLLFFLFFMGSFITYIVLYKHDTFFALSLIGLILLMFKEAMQCYLSCKNYFKSYMNWFELILICLIWIVLLDTQFESMHESLTNTLGIETLRVIRGVTILCASYEVLILFGDLPNFSVSTHMVILKRVFMTFLKSIALYSILLVGFAFCFNTLFGDSLEASTNNTSTESDDENFHNFKHPGLAILKTIVMFSGELEASNLNLSHNDAFYSIIFLMFVFLITIVLLNLINGLSVSDVFQIKAEGHLVDLCQKIHVLNKYERVIMGRTGSMRWLKNIVSIFTNFVHDGKIEIDRNGKIKLGQSLYIADETTFEWLYNFMLKHFIRFDFIMRRRDDIDDAEYNQKSQPDAFFIKMDGNIMKKIKVVLENKNNIGHDGIIRLKLAAIDEKLEFIMKALRDRC